MYLIAEETKERALNHGLEFTINDEGSADNPRDEESSTLVGIDINMPDDIELDGSFESVVANYCRQVLDCTIDNIVWTGVVKHEHGAVTYSTEMPTGDWSSQHEGFIYLTKDAIRDEYTVEAIDQELEDKVLNRFADEMKEYTAWCMDDAYNLEISSVDKKYQDSAWGIFDVNNAVDRVLNELISGLLTSIKEDGKIIDIEVKFEVGAMPSYMSAAHFFNHNINNVFGSVLTLSEYNIDKDAGIISAKVSIDALASFLQLATSVSESFETNLFGLMRSAVVELVDSGKFQAVSEMEVIETLMANTPYREWSPLMLSALIEVIVSQIPFFELIAVSEPKKEPVL